MLTGRTQRASLLIRVPVGPNLLKVHLVTLGNILAMGSHLSSGLSSIIETTSSPYFLNSPSSKILYKLYLIKNLIITEKDVDKVQIQNDIEEVDDLGDEYLDGPDVVGVEVVYEVLGEHPGLVVPLSPVQDNGVQTRDNSRHLQNN